MQCFIIVPTSILIIEALVSKESSLSLLRVKRDNFMGSLFVIAVLAGDSAN